MPVTVTLMFWRCAAAQVISRAARLLPCSVAVALRLTIATV
jgi:hypothetical protein